MTNNQLFEALGYFANPQRNTWIEVEMKSDSKNKFDAQYLRLTNNYPLPQQNNSYPYYVWPQGANKWGKELRLYFFNNNNLPSYLTNLSTTQNRQGYNNTNTRINSNDLIFKLFEYGFVLGFQNESRIRSFVKGNPFINDFNNGFSK